MLKTVLAAAALLCALVASEVRAADRPLPSCSPAAGVLPPACLHQRNFLSRVISINVTMTRGAARSARLAHPPGCPRRAFCGCGAAVRIFGRPVRALWLAANWLRFPRAAPAPGMAAVRRHHVFVLERYLSGNTWLAYDANVGRHATVMHPRSIAGYAIVDPRGAG
jgi:hypothetical protein